MSKSQRMEHAMDDMSVASAGRGLTIEQNTAQNAEAITDKGRTNGLIDREKVIEILVGELNSICIAMDGMKISGYKLKGMTFTKETLKDLIAEIKELPSIPSEIIRCKDCSYFQPETNHPGMGQCLARGWHVWGCYDCGYLAVVDEDGWCYHGERKPGNE